MALLLFLVMTVYHFGEGDTQSSGKLDWVQMIARGGSFLVTIHSNHAEVVEIFTLIVGGDSETSVANVMLACVAMQAVYAIALVSLLVRLFTSLHLLSARNLLIEVVTLNLLYFFAPPLLAFAVYFNLYHSQRHVVRVMRMRTWQVSFSATLLVNRVYTAVYGDPGSMVLGQSHRCTECLE